MFADSLLFWQGTAIVLSLLTWVTYGAGYVRGKRRATPPDVAQLESKLADTRDEALKAMHELRALREAHAQQSQALVKITDERDSYKAVAATPKRQLDASAEVLTKLWTDRPYRSTFDANLNLLTADLKASVSEKDRVTLEIAVRAETGWWFGTLMEARRTSNLRQADPGDAQVVLQGWRFTGTPAQVMRELRDFLDAPTASWGFPFTHTAQLDDGRKQLRWRAPNDPIRLGVHLWRRDPAPIATLPTVEVLRTETQVVYVDKPVVVEREVVREVPVVKDPQDLDALIAARVETELAARLGGR